MSMSVSISFKAHAGVYTLQEPIIIDFSIANEGPERIRFDLGGHGKSNFEFKIAAVNGAVIGVPRLKPEGVGPSGEHFLEPGETYTQKLLFNEWYSFEEPGVYKIKAEMTGPLKTLSDNPVTVTTQGLISMQILDKNPARLEEICKKLLGQVVEAPGIAEAYKAASALSYIRDPIAVPYLEKLIVNEKSYWQFAIPGLGRIADSKAIEILIDTAIKQDAESGKSLARFVLYEIMNNIRDSELKKKVEEVLQS